MLHESHISAQEQGPQGKCSGESIALVLVVKNSMLVQVGILRVADVGLNSGIVAEAETLVKHAVNWIYQMYQWK